MRSREEISNRFLCITRSLTHLVCPSGKLFCLSIFPGFGAQLERARFFHDIYCPSTLPSTFSMAPLHLTTPAPFHRLLLEMLIERLPTNDLQYSVLLHAHVERQLKSITTPQLAASVLPYSRASWARHFPDNRADALYRSHHVLLMEFCLASKLDSGQELIIQATVHPSMRNYILHYPTVHVPVESTRGAFSMKRHTCSCEDGCETHKHRRLPLLAGAMVFAPTSRCCSCRSHAWPTRPSSLYV